MTLKPTWAALGAAMLLLGCGGDDSALLPRVHTLTMINATENTIVSSLFGTEVHSIASRDSSDDSFDDFSEAPVIAYDGGVGEITIHQGEYFNAYVATTCNSVQEIHHTGQRGELHVVNTSLEPVTITFDDGQGNQGTSTVEACSYLKTTYALGKDFKAYLGNEVVSFLESETRVHDLVVFGDQTMKKFEIKSVNL